MADEPGRWITLPEVTGSLLEQALVERQAYRLDAALLLYDAAAVALAATAAAADLQSSGGTEARDPGWCHAERRPCLC